MNSYEQITNKVATKAHCYLSVPVKESYAFENKLIQKKRFETSYLLKILRLSCYNREFSKSFLISAFSYQRERVSYFIGIPNVESEGYLMKFILLHYDGNTSIFVYIAIYIFIMEENTRLPD